MCVWNNGTLWSSRCFRRRGLAGGARPRKFRWYSVSIATILFLKGGTDLLLVWNTCRGSKATKIFSNAISEVADWLNKKSTMKLQVGSVTEEHLKKRLSSRGTVYLHLVDTVLNYIHVFNTILQLSQLRNTVLCNAQYPSSTRQSAQCTETRNTSPPTGHSF